ncbi:MAG TPA: polyphosphate polymerase domain-containing protein [Bacteroidales bacterium]|nr:polyphosphate polymerase domain-containing protein [Bacteroidales bacterium]
MNSIDEILQTFDTVLLEQLDSVKLLNRVDAKYVLKTTLLPEILNNLKNDYFVLEINNKRASHYKTLYFDTPDFCFFYQHQTGRLERTKIRIRTYLETGISFLEIKTKNNHSKTSKERMPILKPEDINDKTCQKFLRKKIDKDTILKPVIEVKYSRITLVNKSFSERLTIDTDLNYKIDGKTLEFLGLCIMELKQDKTAKSTVRDVLREKHIFVSSLSKYCLGVASLYPQVKILKKKLET